MAHEDLKEDITEYLHDHGISTSWLSRRINLSRGFVNNMLRGTGKWERAITEKHLDRINNALGTDFKFPETEEPD